MYGNQVRSRRERVIAENTRDARGIFGSKPNGRRNRDDNELLEPIPHPLNRAPTRPPTLSFGDRAQAAMAEPSGHGSNSWTASARLSWGSTRNDRYMDKARSHVAANGKKPQ